MRRYLEAGLQRGFQKCRVRNDSSDIPFSQLPPINLIHIPNHNSSTTNLIYTPIHQQSQAEANSNPSQGESKSQKPETAKQTTRVRRSMVVPEAGCQETNGRTDISNQKRRKRIEKCKPTHKLGKGA
jgi:hypothetical protein